MKPGKQFEQLITEHIPRLRVYARTLTKDPTAAEDLLQDSLERAFRKFALWKKGTNLRAWLFTLMHNLFLNQIKRQRYARQLEFLEAVAEPYTEEQGELSHDLNIYLHQLNLEQREVIFLVCLERLNYDEVAQTLSIPIGTVMSRLSRARTKLKALIKAPDVNTIRVVK